MTREEAIKRFETLLLHVDTDCVMGMETTEAINLAIEALEQPERKGKWLKAGTYYGIQIFQCSECRADAEVPTIMGDPLWKYCPSCGADMRGDTDGVDN